MSFNLIARGCALCLAVWLGGASPLVAQSGNAGSVQGTVVGPDHIAVAGAHVTLRAPDLEPREQVSGADGSFNFAPLASGEYAVQVEASGFAAAPPSQVVVAVGRVSRLQLQLQLADVQQRVEVVAAPETLDTSQTSSVVNIDRDRVEELPIPSRNYLSFVALAPQVAAANPALLQGSLAQSGGSFSFGGLRPGSNAVYLDDVNDNEEYTGSSRTQLSPEAISDFQIVNHGFAAQSGGGAGGAIDVQTRQGVDRIHGDAFTFVQNGALNATPPLGVETRRPQESRVRLGLSQGGPLRRDKTFYFAAAEQEIAHGEETNALDAALLSSIGAAVRRFQPADPVSLQAGYFPTTDQETEISTRIDHALTARQQLMARYAFTNSRNVNDAFGTEELTDRSSRGSTFVDDNSLNASLASTLSTRLLNTLSFELAQRRVVERTAAGAGPGIQIAGVASLGTPYAGNDRRFETHVELADHATRQAGAHLLQFGIRADHVALRAHVPDAASGLFVFAGLAALQRGTPDLYTQSFGDFDTHFAELRLAGYVQDHWTISPTLTLDAGVRYDANRLPASLPQHALQLSPRLGLAWTLRKSTVIRTGFGTFYDRFQLATLQRVLQQDGTHALTQTVEDSAAATVFQSGQVPAAPLPLVAPSIWSVQPSLPNPYSAVASLSVEQALPWQSTLTAEYQFVRGVHMGRTTNVNLTAPRILSQANAAALGVSSPTAQQLGTLVFSPMRVQSNYDAVQQFATSAGSTYHGATITWNRQFQDDLQLMVGYTYSKTIDDASYDREQPQNPYALGGERAPSLQDQRHRLTLSGLWLLGPDLGDPADAAKNANPGRLMKALYGFEFAPILHLAPGFRANPLTGTDSNREHIYPFAARPIGYGRNALVAPLQVEAELRVLKMVALRGGHLDIVAESFNLPNHRNVTALNPTFGGGATAQPGFATPMAAGDARKVQFSLDYEY
ncbi:MAG: TonB-dependent receptor [Acidobacteriota bacterium]|nr:TonB-dependent receptor [Acidobacteriota bacterium]